MNQKGYGLIEVLISMLVFMLGVMGIAGMQGQAIRVTHDSMQRSQAVWMAHEISERMKVNPEGLDSGVYQATATTANAGLAAYCLNPPTQCQGTVCNANQMARYDIHDLLCENTVADTRIINQQLTITCSTTPCASGSLVDINVSWDSRGATGGVYATRQQLTLTMRR